MNISSKSKKRVVLPSRPELPTVDQILEDISRAGPDDPVFSILEKTGQESAPPADSEVDLRFQQCRRYLELNEQLKEAQKQLQRQREELQAAGEQLDRKVEEVKGSRGAGASSNDWTGRGFRDSPPSPPVAAGDGHQPLDPAQEQVCIENG